MTKYINFELSKKLNDLGLLDNIETKYWIWQVWWVCTKLELEYLNPWYKANECWYKTLTLKEAIMFLPKTYSDNEDYWYKLIITYNNNNWIVMYWDIEEHTWVFQSWASLIEVIEKMIIFLLDNKLLW